MRIWPTKRIWKRLGLGLVILLALALIANGIMAWSIEARLQNKIAAIRASGDPASIADLAPKPIPDAENAAAILDKLAPRLDEFAEDHWRFLDKTSLGKDYDDRAERGEPATTEQLEAIRAILKKYSDIDTGLAAAAACDKYASVADFAAGYPAFLENALRKPMKRIRSAARFLTWRMQTLIAEGQPDKAVEQGIELLRLGRLYDHEPCFINLLGALAVRGTAIDPIYDALSTGPISPALHATLDKELLLNDDSQRMVRALKTERGFSIDAIKALPPDVGHQPPGWLFSLVGWPVKRYYVGVLDYYDDDIAMIGQPWTERHNKFGGESTGRGVLADLMVPGIGSVCIADARTTAQLRGLRIDNALRAFAEKNGREAKGLEELGLPRAATVDPFSGEPLKLKHTDDGWIVYSVMENGVDDGGDFKDLKDYGVAPRKWRRVQ